MTVLKSFIKTFKKGSSLHLDECYRIMGLFPENSENPFYHQCDIGDLEHYSSTASRDGKPNDCGEYIHILRDFTIRYSVTS